MISYKDKWFCTYYKDCDKAQTCHRPLTEKVLKDAEKWWKSFNSDEGPPISIQIEKPYCHSSNDKK